MAGTASPRSSIPGRVISGATVGTASPTLAVRAQRQPRGRPHARAPRGQGPPGRGPASRAPAAPAPRPAPPARAPPPRAGERAPPAPAARTSVGWLISNRSSRLAFQCWMMSASFRRSSSDRPPTPPAAGSARPRPRAGVGGPGSPPVRLGPAGRRPRSRLRAPRAPPRAPARPPRLSAPPAARPRPPAPAPAAGPL